MRTVAVLGAGPAGSVAAAHLASAGLRTILIDEKLAWEKPCGGGLTFKAYRRYPYLLEGSAPKHFVTESVLRDEKGASVTMKLDRPVLIYSRLALNQMLLDRAAAAGASIEKQRVTGLEREGPGWKVRTGRGSIAADFCVLATGARNTLRNAGTEWAPGDLMCAMGYYVPASQPHIDLLFFPGIAGYLWVFPRCGHLSVGICAKGVPSAELRRLLESYMDGHGYSRKDASFYAHVIPSLPREGWERNRISGDGWLAVGDAAGLVDPVTGEGLYYAMRSGELAAETILADQVAPAEKPLAYRQRAQAEFLADLTYASRLVKRFFNDRFLFGSMPARMIEAMRYSPRMRQIVSDLFAGTQGYLDLKQRLLSSRSRVAWEMLTYAGARLTPSWGTVSE